MAYDKKVPYEKSLACLRPELAKEWHPTKNGALKPEDVTIGSGINAWWFKPYDDPETGKHFDFEWQSEIFSRASGIGCPFLSTPSKGAWKGFNDLATLHPEIAKEWHPTKNGALKPEDVTIGSGKNVWWYLPYDDPVTGKHFDFEWESTISGRASGIGCPFLSVPSKAVWKGFNDLATVNPELAKEWHPTKNGDLKPEDFTIGSGKNVWWLKPYDDPITGKHFDFEWQSTIVDRDKHNNVCPFLSTSARVWKGFNDLATLHPEIAKEWHPTKNGDLKPEDVTSGSNRKVWWFKPYDDPETGKHFDFEWQSKICNRVSGMGCPFLTGTSIWKGFNDLATLYPDLAKEWHPTKNGDLKPEDVTCGSVRKIWWLYPYDVPEDYPIPSLRGKHFDFEWETGIHNRTALNCGCPFLGQGRLWKGFNDLETVNPDMAKYWHPSKNGKLLPSDVTRCDHAVVWWLIPFEWRGETCFIEVQRAVSKFNYDGIIKSWCGKQRAIERKTAKQIRKLLPKKKRSVSQKRIVKTLAEARPDLAKQLHPVKNGDLTPDNVGMGCKEQLWWLYPYDVPDDYPVPSLRGKHFDFEWKCILESRLHAKSECPFLAKSGTVIWPGFNDLATVRPDLAEQWHPTKNGGLLPTMVTATSGIKVWWLYPYDVPDDYPVPSLRGKHFDFEWMSTVANRSKSQSGCPFLSKYGKKLWVGFNDLATTHPDIASEWHPTKNGDVRPEDVTAGDKRVFWWMKSYDDPVTGKHFDFEWQSNADNRTRGKDCPYLSNRAVLRGFNDLATLRPELAKEWHPTKNGDLKPEDVACGSNRRVWWYLPYDDQKNGVHYDFEWETIVHSRALSGAGCPFLSESYGEQHLSRYFSEHGIEAKYEKSFDDLRGVGGNRLTYDFWVKNTVVFIEYQGQQHYRPIDYFGGEEQFKIQKEHDRRKRKYAKQHDYQLIEIHYKYDTYEKIEAYLDEHLLPLLRKVS